MPKQTAVEQLKQDIDLEIKSRTKMVVNWDMYLAMEKEQIVDAYQKGYLDLIYKPKAYYNETYKGGQDES